MEDQEKRPTQDAQLSEDELKQVAGGNDANKQRLDNLNSQGGSVDDIQEARLERMDARSKS